MRNDAEMFAFSYDKPPTVREIVSAELKAAQSALEVAKETRSRLAAQLAEQEENVRRLDAACMEYSHWLRNNK